MEIDFNCTIKKEVTIGRSGNQKKVNFPKTFDENGLGDYLKVGKTVVLCMDKKNGYIFFPYTPEAIKNVQG